MFARIASQFLRAIGHWLPIVAAAGLLVHLSWLGLRPALIERERLHMKRDVIAAESQQLSDELRELRTLERALEDPIYQERLRWQWRLDGGSAALVGAESAGGTAPRDVETREERRDDGQAVPLSPSPVAPPLERVEPPLGRIR